MGLQGQEDAPTPRIGADQGDFGEARIADGLLGELANLAGRRPHRVRLPVDIPHALRRMREPAGRCPFKAVSARPFPKVVSAHVRKGMPEHTTRFFASVIPASCRATTKASRIGSGYADGPMITRSTNCGISIPTTPSAGLFLRGSL
jgi:hypothetical protein